MAVAERHISGTGTLTVASGATLTDDATTGDVPTLEAPLVVDGSFNVAANNGYWGLFMVNETDGRARSPWLPVAPSTWPWTSPATP